LGELLWQLFHYHGSIRCNVDGEDELKTANSAYFMQVRNPCWVNLRNATALQACSVPVANRNAPIGVVQLDRTAQ
jgi:hypothetical protein